MNRIVDKQILSENIVKLVIESPRIAEKREPGHFVIVKLNHKGERIPLTISQVNTEKGTITLIIQKVGVTSTKLANFETGDEVAEIVGPLGKATHIEKVGTVLCAGGGVGVAPLLPIVEAMNKKGNRVVSVIAARSKDLLVLEKEITENSHHIIVMTDDGSYGEKGLITNGMEKIIKNEKIDLAVCIGPAIMMKYASLLTKKYNIKTVASLNTIMVDGTGMCGACRISVGDEIKFVCVDGPEFNAHDVDFDELIMRLGAYKSEEANAFEYYMKSHK